MKGSMSKAHSAKNFLELMVSRWNTYASCSALHMMGRAKWNKDDMIPLTEEVKKLQSHLKALQQDALKILEEDPSPDAWTAICQSLLTEIILFNRRREGEASKLLLETYISRNSTSAHQDVYGSLSKFEQTLLNHFTGLEVHGKRERKVLVLLTKEMVSSTDVLIKHRRKISVP